MVFASSSDPKFSFECIAQGEEFADFLQDVLFAPEAEETDFESNHLPDKRSNRTNGFQYLTLPVTILACESRP